ncbi:hypothetical protein BS78_07G201600 [Paspalum vaginatum]|nr:hypothetical protein BS78_07G201600 [Paspalum vaginatum]KAJ1269307.1 hypothetical protein BS78_07G201600 [Paspalum vaginatum]
MPLISDKASCISPSCASRSKNKAWKMRGDTDRLLPVISFFLGAALTAAVVFLGATTDANWRLSQLAAWGNGGRPVSRDEVKLFAELAELLRNASMEDNTVIVTSINQAYAAPGSLLDLFLESFRLGKGTAGLLDHVLIVAVDPGALQTCRSLHRHCYLLRPDGAADLSAEKFFMTKDYVDMMWARNLFQQTILELGFNFLFTDVDIMWFRNPMRHIAVTADIAIASDFFNGDPDSLHNLPNGGFLYVRSKNRTVEFYRRWRLARGQFPPGTNEQHVLARMQLTLTRQLGVRMQFLDTAHCGGFCQLSADLRRVSTMHANCCTGLPNKVHDLRTVLQDWRNYTAAPREVRRGGGFRWTTPGRCIH